MPDDPAAADKMKVPWWSWANILSLDAVAIGLLWQWVFTVQFCRRYPTLPECGIIGVSIWLVYTADRLFDSLRLDRDRPHTLRHRIHLEFRNPLVAVWVAALAVDVTLVLSFASTTQLRWGYVAVAVVLAYVAGVHASRPARVWIPKELQAGMVFALGVSLTAWSQSSGGESSVLLLSTLMAGILFASNCLSVACWERELDRSQGFDSWVTRHPGCPRWLPFALAGHLVLSVAMLLTQLLPLFMASCLIASDLFLLLVWVASRGREDAVRSRPLSITSASPLGVVADVAIVIPPMLWVVADPVLQ
jgi:hypothetical protein